MMQQRQPSQEATTEADVEPLTSSKKKNKNNKRRFSDEQVTSLETIFASETKLEPKKKVQVARELGLQPRQVAIWFQNKRARWKSKQLEKNYRILKTSYDNLKARFDSLRKEKESLLDQLQELHGLLEKSHKGSSAGCKDSVANSQYMIKLDNKDEVAELPVKSSSLHLQEEMDQQGMLYSDDDKSGNMAYLGQDEPDQLMNISENIEGTSTISLVKWCSFDAGNLFDQSSTSSHWWDTWA